MGETKPDRTPGDDLPPRRAVTSAELLEAALGYAARGWPVFPCNPSNKQPLLAAKKDGEGKKIKGTGGVSAASTDPAQIASWWAKWPNAMIGLATGHPTLADAHGNAIAPLPPKDGESAPGTSFPRLFVLDFDPREDPESGEVWTLEGLKHDTEAQLGCALPTSLAGLTPSDGVHLYLLQADEADPITNRGNLPEHVDVRGLSGYVIAPPSVMADGRRYRWHRREPVGGIAAAPARLLEVLRERKGKAAAEGRLTKDASHEVADLKRDLPSVDDAVRKYALAALDGECQAVRVAASGQRNAQLNTSALKIASLVAGGALEATLARSCLEAAARDNPGRDDDAQLLATIDSGWSAGIQQPRDLEEVAASARSRRERGSRPRPSGAPRPPVAATGQQSAPFQSGRGGPSSPKGPPAALTKRERARLERIAGAWLSSRLEAAERTPDALKAIAWGVGRRAADKLLDIDAAKERLWEVAELVADLSLADIDRAVDEGFCKGFDPGPALADLKLAQYPMTDFGIAERFRDRYGADFRFTTAKGWLGWDGRRWKVLDQDEKSPPAEVIAAVFDTIRSIQREARRVKETDARFKLVDKGKQQDLDLDDEREHAADHWMLVGKSWKLFSTVLAGWGRQSEQSGKPAAIALLARRWLTVPIEAFDCEQMAINVMNGTLRFATEILGDGSKRIAVRLDDHQREDLITRLAPVDYDREAASPLYDAMIAWAQPDPAVRRYVHQVGGYSCTGDTGEHKLWFHYGRGRNGKSTTIDSWCSALGDYSGTIGIESFLDQGIKKRGDAATPDLAKLGGVRLLRASEPERGAKLNSALIKAATGGEPMSVRALHRGFFDLMPRFKLQMSGNSKPSIPDTDEGIWGRMKLVPWLRHIEKPEEDPYRDRFPCEVWPVKDLKLTDKMKAGELPGIFLRLVQGLVDYLEHGLVEPEGVTEATAAYRAQSDPLARFLLLCTEPAAGERVKSSEIHEVFAAWCKAAGEKEWTPKGFSEAMIDKGFSKTRSDGMRWEGLKLIRQVSDFVDAEGRVRLLSDDLSADPPAPPSAASAADSAFQGDDDDLPI